MQGREKKDKRENKISLPVRAVAHAVSLRPFIAEARFFPWARPCRICGELSDSWDRFLSPRASVFPLPALHTIFIVKVLLSGQVGDARNFPAVLFQISGNGAQGGASNCHSSQGTVVG